MRKKGVAHVVDFAVLQLNDVYDAAPVEGGQKGGLARVATLYRTLEKENPNILVTLSGDFVSPSVISSITGDEGKHMIESLNALGLTHATMGNHEFDISQQSLLSRIGESRFRWVVSNVKDDKGQPLPNVISDAVVSYAGAGGETVRVAILGLCLDMKKKAGFTFQDPIASARAEVEALRDKADVFVAMTHLTMAQDKQLAAEVPRLDVLLGGHEHEAAKDVSGEDMTPIYKADSNARTAYVHKFRFDTATKTTKLFSKLVPIDATLAEEPKTDEIVDAWSKRAFDKLRAEGNDPQEVVGHTDEALQGYEADVRSKPTNLTELIIQSFIASVPEADAAILASGMVRIDGVIPPGDITFFDVVRIFPIDDKLSLLEMPGALLRTLLAAGDASKGNGGFQIRANIKSDGKGSWLVGDAPLTDEKKYKILFSNVSPETLSQPPFQGSGTKKIRDAKTMRATLTERLRRDLAKGKGPAK